MDSHATCPQRTALATRNATKTEHETIERCSMAPNRGIDNQKPLSPNLKCPFLTRAWAPKVRICTPTPPLRAPNREPSSLRGAWGACGSDPETTRELKVPWPHGRDERGPAPRAAGRRAIQLGVGHAVHDDHEALDPLHALFLRASGRPRAGVRMAGGTPMGPPTHPRFGRGGARRMPPSTESTPVDAAINKMSAGFDTSCVGRVRVGLFRPSWAIVEPGIDICVGGPRHTVGRGRLTLGWVRPQSRNSPRSAMCAGNRDAAHARNGVLCKNEGPQAQRMKTPSGPPQDGTQREPDQLLTPLYCSNAQRTPKEVSQRPGMCRALVLSPRYVTLSQSRRWP